MKIEKTEKNGKRARKPVEASCDNCEYFDFDEDYGENVCTLGAVFDEDDYAKMNGEKSRCPYFKFYDEYKFVQTQN